VKIEGIKNTEEVSRQSVSPVSMDKSEFVKRVADLESKNVQLSIRNDELLFSLEQSLKPFTDQIQLVEMEKERESKLLLHEITKYKAELGTLQSKLIGYENGEQAQELKMQLRQAEDECRDLRSKIDILLLHKHKVEQELHQKETMLQQSAIEISKLHSKLEKSFTFDSTNAMSSLEEYPENQESLKEQLKLKNEEIRHLKEDVAEMRRSFSSQVKTLMEQIHATDRN
jgi:hypothetical protein